MVYRFLKCVLFRKGEKVLTIMVLNRVWFSREPQERINVFPFSTQNELYRKRIIQAEFSGEFYYFLTSAVMRSLITLQQSQWENFVTVTFIILLN